VSLNDKLEEGREYATADIGLEMKVTALAKVVDILLAHAPEHARGQVKELLGE
jgi:hypothetical protein